jgi:diaminopimelate epimerase
LPPEKGVDADVRMRMFNADGSESEMCGNGIRCVCKLAHDDGLSRANPMRVQTGRGVLTLNYTLDGVGKVDRVTVDMGEPLWHADEVGLRVEELQELVGELMEDSAADLIFEHMNSSSQVLRGGGVMQASSATLHMRWLSMGNPHIVFCVSDVKAIPLERLGPMIEHHSAFTRRINAHFVQVHSPGEVTMRTWERGSGTTLACGTGASAVCVAGVLTGLTDREILAHLPGGDLNLRWDEKTNHVFKTGPATEVFRGVWCE